jgi:hypothetical protein
MVMRFCGGGVGHKSYNNTTKKPPGNACAEAEMGGDVGDVGEGVHRGGGEVNGDKGTDADGSGADDSDKELEGEDPESGEERDYGYAGEEEEESEEGEGDSDDADGDGLGPEDGEDDWDDDLEGFAAL